MALHLEAVSLTYPHSNKVALSQISYTFPTGTTAIVGPNGAGKSTLVKLLTGLLQPTSGSISVQLPDGAVLSPAELHKSVLFQEPSHLYLTIRQNITMRFASTLDDDESIYEALETAGLGRLVGELPDGIDTLVGAGFGGRLDLSGGQWQRLALARLIYQDAPVMILDEPVASLDPEGERAVFELFSHLTRDKIIIFTTHRYDSIPEDTTIVVLADGRITETGTHDDLLRQQREYWSLYVSSSQKVRNAETAGDHRQAGVRRLGCKSIRRQQRSGARADDAVDAANVGGAVETRSRATAGQVRRSLGVVVGVAALVLAAAVLVGAMAVRHGVGGTPNAVATPATAPQLVSEQPAPAPTPRPAVIEPAVRVGWQAWPDDPRSGAWPGADGYHLVVRQPDQFIAVDAPLTPPVRDVILRATFRKVGGPPGGGYGVIVRDDDSGQPDGQSRAGGFYLLEANDTGAVGIWRRDGVNWRDLLPWTSTTAVRPGQAINQLEVQASGPLLTLRINGITVASWSEASGEPGRVGVFVGGGVGTDVRLDDFSVQVPK